MTPDIVTENLKEAEHLASTLALYRLCKGQVRSYSEEGGGGVISGGG